jgi:hypothetical protein
MRARRLKSSLIDRIVFDEEAHTLRILFRGARAYIYEGVPRAIYDGLAGAASAGAFFNSMIKGRYPCRPERRRHRPA